MAYTLTPYSGPPMAHETDPRAATSGPARLPELPELHEPETADGRGLRVLLFVLAHRLTATLADDDLARGLHAATLAGVRPDAAELPAVYWDRLADAGRLLAGALRYRQTLQAAPARVTPGGGESDPAGPMAPLVPVPGRFPSGGLARQPDPVEF